jgi:hypothetical protein
VAVPALEPDPAPAATQDAAVPEADPANDAELHEQAPAVVEPLTMEPVPDSAPEVG